MHSFFGATQKYSYDSSLRRSRVRPVQYAAVHKSTKVSSLKAFSKTVLLKTGASQMSVLRRIQKTLLLSTRRNRLGKGLKVTATDINKDAEQKLKEAIALYAPQISQDLLKFKEDLENAVRGVHFVQECGTEQIDLKQELFRKLDAYTNSSVLLVSSSSGIRPSVFQAKAINPQRILLGHPFNPPHIIPLVEVCGGTNTSPEAIVKTMEFYKSIGKRPIQLRREMDGHVASRLQAALWQEAFFLVQQGVVSVQDLDTAITEGPGLRWAMLGPFLNMHLAGGTKGIKHFLTHLGPPINSWIKNLGKVSVDKALIDLLSEGVEQFLSGKKVDQLVRERDELLQQLKHLKEVSQDGS